MANGIRRETGILAQAIKFPHWRLKARPLLIAMCSLNSDATTQTSITIPNATVSLGTTVGSDDVIVQKGNFTINLTGSSSIFAAGAIVIGYGSGDNTGATPSLQFTSAVVPPVAGNIQFRGLDIGQNGSSGNTFDLGGLQGADIVYRSITTPAIIIGSSGGGSNNELLLNTGESFNARSGIFTINTAGTTAASNNSFVVNGGSFSETGAATINGYYNAANPGNIINSNNSVVVENGGTSAFGITTLAKGPALLFNQAAPAASINSPLRQDRAFWWTMAIWQLPAA